MKAYFKTFVVIFCLSLCSMPVFAACPTSDFSRDCRVDFKDFAVMAGLWLVDYDSNDLAVMALEWQTEGIPAEPGVMAWVLINDSGAGMKDGNGNPISHGGFNGYMSKYETTNAQYCQYLNAAKYTNHITVYNNTVYATSDTGHLRPYFLTYAAYAYSQITYAGGIFCVRSRDGYSMDNHPVTSVSLYGASAFCTYYGFRLPTDWEWQAVADYDGTFIYGCGETISKSKANYVDNGYANPLHLTSYPYTSPVGYYPAYGYGMCDMAGNVMEWTSTAQNPYYILRGGHWGDSGPICTVSFRNTIVPYASGTSTGFRACY